MAVLIIFIVFLQTVSSIS